MGRIWLLCAFGMMVCLVAASGCDNQEKMIDPKGTLESLAAEYWNKRLIDKDYKATYEMEAEKGSLPFDEYTQRIYNAGKIKYVSLKVKEAKIDKDKGLVDIIIKWELPPLKKSFETNMGDEWIMQSNRWKHVLPEKRTELPKLERMPGVPTRHTDTPPGK
jgi:hypothetical protein